MCLIAFALDMHPKYRLILVANRDEFFERPTSPAMFWPIAPHLLAGRDDRAGGTWCGLTRDGRFASVTNFREPPDQSTKKLSRGALPVDFLASSRSSAEYAESIANDAARYSGFNLLVDDGVEMVYFSNRGRGPEHLGAGVYGLSNDLLDTPWPKVVRAKTALSRMLQHPDPDPGHFLDLLSDTTIAPDSDLPDTGFGRAWERILSPVFISAPDYGTRCSTIVMVSRKGDVLFEEWTHLPDRPRESSRRFEW
jgi:uncharacterized protein with NRDE domain